MRTKMILLFSGLLILTILQNCKKDSAAVDYSAIELQRSQVKINYENAKAFNDTLVKVYDTTNIRKNNPICIRYDKLYHKNDSMYTMHYRMFGDDMYKYGIMMPGYTASDSMVNVGMHGGMMNGGMMDMNVMKADTSDMGNYYRMMGSLRQYHQSYHNGIYN